MLIAAHLFSLISSLLSLAVFAVRPQQLSTTTMFNSQNAYILVISIFSTWRTTKTVIKAQAILKDEFCDKASTSYFLGEGKADDKASSGHGTNEIKEVMQDTGACYLDYAQFADMKIVCRSGG